MTGPSVSDEAGRGALSARRGGPGDVLALVRSGTATTRAALMEASGLSRSTLAQRLDLLIGAGYLAETGSIDSTGGRPAVTLQLRAEAGLLLVADIGGEHMRTAVTDLAGSVRAHREATISVADGPAAVLGRVRREFAALLRTQRSGYADVRGMSIGVPGPVDHDTGTVVSPPIMSGWDGFVVPDYFAAQIDGPVLVDKDTNLLALGEFTAAGGAYQHLLVVKAGTGVGGGLVLGGRLHRGHRGSAGDIGHVLAYRAGGLSVADASPAPLCRCGNLGCVEAYAGGWAIARDLRADGRDVRTTADVVAAVQAGDAAAIAALREAGRTLGHAVAAAVNLLGPTRVIISGALADAQDHLLAGVREVAFSRSLPLATRDLAITASELRNMAGVLGGARMVADALFDPAVVDAALLG